MMTRLLLFLLLVPFVACTQSGDDAPYEVRIAPIISTRVTGLHFDAGDRIGLKMVKGAENYQLNTPLTYDGAAFTAEGLLWYPTNELATLSAYYPYREAGFPDEFTVEADQGAGCVRSDLLGAVKGEVVPAATPVGMVFSHLLAQLSVVVTNDSGKEVTDVVIDGFSPTATLDWATATATVKSGVAATEITTYCVTSGALYRAILVPQQAMLTVKITTDDAKQYTKTVIGAQLVSGKRYDLAVTLTPAGLSLSLSGDLNDWAEGGSLNDNSSGGGSSGDPENELEYQGEKYATVSLAGKVWMAENLRYQPVGVALEQGVWYPNGNLANRAKLGLLYNRTVALAGGTTPPVQGICPAGWHIPSDEELSLLLSGTPADFFSCAGWWVPTTASYSNLEKGLLLSSSLLEAKGVYLSYAADGTMSRKTLPADWGVSVRCVKD